MEKRWRIYPHESERIVQLERTASVSPVVAQLLIARGIEHPDAARAFLDVRLNGLREPSLLPGAREAADKVYEAVRAGKRIAVYGDYDADGMTGASILIRCLKLLDANVTYYVPNRLNEGYGLNDQALEKLKGKGVELVISVDCGIASIQSAQTAKRLGMMLVVTDHHEFAETLPEADAIVHPRLPGSTYPFGGLCGAGVALKLAWAICQRASGAEKVTPKLRDFLLSAVGIAAIGTVADVVPLLDENRILVRYGLTSLKERPVLGLAELMKVTGLADKSKLGAEDIGFTIAPRLNAAGRLGQAQLGVELLTTEDPERAKALAEYIHELNSSRDRLERRVLKAAREQIKEKYDEDSDPAFVLAGVGWHPGVIGIVAGRIAEKFNRPVIIIAIDESGVNPATGSARTARSGVHLHRALTACSERLIGYGGHAAAAGLKISPEQIDAFRDEFCEYVSGELPQNHKVIEVRIDAEATLPQLTWRTVQLIESLAPFGEANPRPLLCASNVKLVGKPKTMGGGDRHLTLQISQFGKTFRAVAFGQGDRAKEFEESGSELDVAFRPIINEYQGYQKVELHVEDWRKAASE